MMHGVECPYPGRTSPSHHPQTRHHQRMFSYIIPSIRYQRRLYITSHFTDQTGGKHHPFLRGVCQEFYAAGSWNRAEYTRPMKIFSLERAAKKVNTSYFSMACMDVGWVSLPFRRKNSVRRSDRNGAFIISTG